MTEVIPIKKEERKVEESPQIEMPVENSEFIRALFPPAATLIGRSIKRRDIFVLAGAIDVLTSPVTVATTVTETDLFSFKFNRNEFHNEMVLRLYFSGVYSNTNGADTFDLKVKMTDSVGATTYSTITSTAVAVTNVGFNGSWVGTIYTIGSSGTIQPDLIGRINNVNKVEADSSTVAIDTTKDQTISLTITWSANTAGNTATIRQAVLEILN